MQNPLLAQIKDLKSKLKQKIALKILLLILTILIVVIGFKFNIIALSIIGSILIGVVTNFLIFNISAFRGLCKLQLNIDNIKNEN